MPLKFTAALLALLALANSANASNLLTPQQKLGQKLYRDINLSINRNQSCESCHTLSRIKVPTEKPAEKFKLLQQPAPAMVDPANIIEGTAVSTGSRLRNFGNMNAPSTAYAAFSPDFYWDGELFIGGQFWNGRAKDLAAQAEGPFINPLEMAMPSKWSVIKRLQENKHYRKLFKRVYGINLNRVAYGSSEVETTYKAMAQAIAAFERSQKFNRFDSKFDYEAAGLTSYNEAEQRGADLFDGAALCSECHSTEGIAGDDSPALLTDFSYDNLGVPANPQIPGLPAADPGLLGNPNLENIRGAPTPRENIEGRHKVMSLRNIALTPPYMHNGVFKTLEEVVHFYNTRDVLPHCEEPADANNPGFGKSCWPKGEFHETRNSDELGDLGLSEQDEADIVAYLKTFTDNYPLWGNRNGLNDPGVPEGTPSPFADFPVPE